jgi:hypothetical protein
VILGEFDGLGLGIKDHDAIIPAWSPRGRAETGAANYSPVGHRPIVLTFK